MIGAYRSIGAVIEDRLAGFRERRAREQEADGAIARVYAARRGRIAGAVVGASCGVVLLLLSGLVGLDAFRAIELELAFCRALPTYFLAASGIAALLVAAVTRRLARRHAAAALQREPALTGAGPADVARIESADPLGDLRARADFLETKSVALPLAALALLAPPAIHGVLALGIAASVHDCRWLTADGLGVCIGVGTLLMGLAHLTLALRVRRWAASLRGRQSGTLGEGVHAAWIVTLLIAAAAGFVPGFVIALNNEGYALMPPLVVLATGAAFLPFAYVATARRLERERAILARPRPSLGRA